VHKRIIVKFLAKKEIVKISYLIRQVWPQILCYSQSSKTSRKVNTFKTSKTVIRWNVTSALNNILITDFKKVLKFCIKNMKCIDVKKNYFENITFCCLSLCKI